MAGYDPRLSARSGNTRELERRAPNPSPELLDELMDLACTALQAGSVRWCISKGAVAGDRHKQLAQNGMAAAKQRYRDTVAYQAGQRERLTDPESDFGRACQQFDSTIALL